MSLKILKAVLYVVGIGYLFSFVVLFLPWDIMDRVFHFFRMEPIPEVPVAMYIIRVSYALFGLVGIFFIILAANPLRYPAMLTLAFGGMLALGIVMLYAGLLYEIESPWYLADPLFCFMAGIAIPLSWWQARKKKAR